MSTPSASRDRLTEPFEGTGAAYYGLVAVAVLLVVGMLYSFITVLTSGHGITGLGNWGTSGGVPWGLDIGAFAWWAGIGVGAIALSAIIRVFRLEDYKPYARVGELLAPLAFFASFLHVVFDLGRPGRVFNTIIHLPLNSPIAWDVILLGGLGILSIIYLVVAIRSDLHLLSNRGVLPSSLGPLYGLLLSGYEPSMARTNGSGDGDTADTRGSVWWLAAIILVFIPLVAGGVVPFAWGMQGSTMNWFGAIQGPTFLIQSLTLGAAAILLLAGILRYAYGLDEVFTDRSFRRLGVVAGALALTYMLGVFYEIQSGLFAADMADPNVGTLVFDGALAPLLWLAIAAIVVSTIYLVVQQASGRFSVLGTAVFAVVLLVAILHQETWLVVGGLMYPDLMYPVGEYAPSIYEWLNIAGTTGLVALGLLVFVKTLPMISADVPGREESEA